MMCLYIDPGTGSMLFTILIAVIGSLIYLLRNVWMKLGVFLSGGKRGSAQKDRMPILIFSDNKRYWNTFEPICDELEKRGQEVFYWTESADDPALSRQFQHIHAECIGEGNRAYAKLNMAKAWVVLSTTPGLDVYQWKRSREVAYYVHIPHAPNDITLYRMFGLDFYDAVLLSGNYQVDQIRELEKLRNLPEKEIEIVGLPYMDEAQKRLETAEPLSKKEGRTVLVAPSWGPSAILSRYGEKMIDALLSTGYQVIIRPHPQSFSSEKELIEKLMKRYPDGDQLQWNRDNDNFDVLRRSDILISDFSGVIFDYTLVHDKPILYADTAFDNAIYDACWIEKPLWTFKVLPELGEQVTEDMLPQIKTIIDRCIENPKYQRARAAAREETWMHQGEGAVRAADYLLEKLNQIRKDETETPVQEGKTEKGKRIRRKK